MCPPFISYPHTTETYNLNVYRYATILSFQRVPYQIIGGDRTLKPMISEINRWKNSRAVHSQIALPLLLGTAASPAAI